MFRLAFALLCALALAGCEPPPAEVALPEPDPPEMEAPDYGASTRIGLLRQRGTLKVGDTAERAMDLFQAPRRAREFRELPAKLAPPYRAEGWESSSEGFGVILYEGRVAAAVHTWEQATDEQVDELVASYQSHLRSLPETVVGRSGRYWFWEMPRLPFAPTLDTSAPPASAPNVKQRLMLVAVRSNGAWVLTEAMGDVFAMNALRANPTAARTELEAADAELAAAVPQGDR